jgi:hypothetical protein
MANYSFEKGKHGGPTGTIFPFFRVMDGLLPVGEDFRDFAPAGFLKCRGQILQADQFPALAEILGVGATCIYKKETTILQERNSDGTGGTFQLPDLGSKFITTSSSPGQYSNTTILDTSNNIFITKAGVGVSIQSNQDQVEFSYDGNFSISALPLTFSGNWRFLSPPAKTQSTTLSISNFVAHGHLGDIAIAARVNQNNTALQRSERIPDNNYYSSNYCPRGGAGIAGGRVPCSGTANFGVQLLPLTLQDVGSDTGHAHPLATPSLSVSGPVGSIPAANLSASSITTTVNIRKSSAFKMDDVAPKFILCEYLIKL